MFFKRGRSNIKEGEVEIDCSNYLYIDDDLNKLLKKYELLKMWENKKKEVKFIGMMKGIVFYLLFIFFMVIVCYGNKNNNCYLMISFVKILYLKFEIVSDLCLLLKNEFVLF